MIGRRALLQIAPTVALAAPALRARAAEPIKATLGYQSLWAVGGQIFETLRHTNILALNGITAQFRTFTYGGPLGEAAVAGDIDNIFAADAPTLRAMARIPGSKVLQRTHDQRFAIMVRPDFQGTLADLKGKKLSGPFGTTVFPRCMQALIAAGIKDPFREMTIINQDIAEQADTIHAGLVDAVTTWDPTYQELLQRKLAKVLWQAPLGEGMGIQGMSGPWLRRYGNDGAVALLKSWIMATWWTSNNIAQANAWFAKTSRLPVDLLNAANAADRYLARPQPDIRSLNFLITSSDISDTQTVMDFLYAQRLLTHRLVAAPFYDMAPLRQAQQEIAAGRYPALAKITVTAG